MTLKDLSDIIIGLGLDAPDYDLPAYIQSGTNLISLDDVQFEFLSDRIILSPKPIVDLVTGPMYLEQSKN